jgi:hypothetical protein
MTEDGKRKTRVITGALILILAQHGSRYAQVARGRTTSKKMPEVTGCASHTHLGLLDTAL